MSNTIEIENLTKKYTYKKTSQIIFQNLKFSVEEADMIAIVGESGEGKTTLLNILGLLDTKYSGNYLFNNDNMKNIDEKQAALIRNEQIGFVLQESAVIMDMKIIDNILLPSFYSRHNSINYHKKAEYISKRLGIEDLLEKYPKMLSGGQKARVILARALLMNPKLILADEPTASLDEKNKKKILNYFTELNNEGVTIITVTHDKTVADHHSKVYKLEKGILDLIKERRN